MNDYQKEQWDALININHHLNEMKPESVHSLEKSIVPYLQFRKALDIFLDEHFSGHCTESCFQSSVSACCSKDGIITFWADMVINACRSTPGQMTQLFNAVRRPLKPGKCIYLGPEGCYWRIRPLVCAMFLCDAAKEAVFPRNSDVQEHWHTFEQTAKSFRWPDRPVLFDHIEHLFIAAGCRSSLMYLNTSPGLLRIKHRAGVPLPE